MLWKHSKSRRNADPRWKSMKPMQNWILLFLVPTSHVTTVSDSSHIPKHRRQACISAMVASKALRTEDVEALRREDKSNLPNCNVLAAFFKGHFIGIHCHHAPPKWVPGICFCKSCAEKNHGANLSNHRGKTSKTLGIHASSSCYQYWLRSFHWRLHHPRHHGGARNPTSDLSC